jgi:hypothetical protein
MLPYIAYMDPMGYDIATKQQTEVRWNLGHRALAEAPKIWATFAGGQCRCRFSDRKRNIIKHIVILAIKPCPNLVSMGILWLYYAYIYVDIPLHSSEVNNYTSQIGKYVLLPYLSTQRRYILFHSPAEGLFGPHRAPREPSTGVARLFLYVHVISKWCLCWGDGFGGGMRGVFAFWVDRVRREGG